MGRFIATAFAAASVFLYSFPALAGSLWLADHKNLYQVDTSTNQIARSLKLDTFDQLAADPSGVWVLSNKQLQRFDTGGNPVLSVDLKPLMKDADQIAVDGVDNSVWISGKKEIQHLTASGQSLGSYTMAQHEVIAIAVGLDQTLWLLDKKLLSHYTAQGALLASIDVHASVKPEPKPKLLALDAIGYTMWLAGDDNLIQIDLMNPTNVKLALDTVKKVQAMALNPNSGTLWVVTDKALLAYSHDGVLIKNLDLKTLGIKDPSDLEFDAKEQGVWVGHKDGASRFSATGDFIITLSTDKKTEFLAIAPFTLGPTLSLISPVDGSVTKNPAAVIAVGYGALCSGSPCGFSNSYYGTYRLNASLNSQPVGESFVFDAATGQSRFEPATRLTEGLNSFTAQATDSFGRLSNAVTSSFTVDTAAPKIAALAPPDGSVFGKAGVAITGSVDDKDAQVTLENLANWNGTGQNPAIQNFSYQVMLNSGLNTFQLIATDKAGNTAQTKLNLSYVPVTVTVLSPADGETRTTDSTTVTGSYTGPPNTNVLVNGVDGAAANGDFSVTIPLAVGENTITITATSPDGVVVTSTMQVTRQDINNKSPIVTFYAPSDGDAFVAPATISIIAGASDPDGYVDSFRATVSSASIVDIPFRVGESGFAEYWASDFPAGTYTVTATAIDDLGATTTNSITFTVGPDPADAPFLATWNGMNDALRAKNINGAAAYLSNVAQEKYRPVFEALTSRMTSIIDSYSPLTRVFVGDGIAEFAVNRVVDGENLIFFIYFLRDADGVWRLDSM